MLKFKLLTILCIVASNYTYSQKNRCSIKFDTLSNCKLYEYVDESAEYPDGEMKFLDFFVDLELHLLELVGQIPR